MKRAGSAVRRPPSAPSAEGDGSGEGCGPVACALHAVVPLVGLLAVAVGLAEMLRPPAMDLASVRAVPVPELQDRVRRIREGMSGRGLDAVVLYADEYRPGHGTYLTLFKPMNMIEQSPQVVVICNDSVTLAVGNLNSFAAADTVWIPDQRRVQELDDWLPPLLASARRVGLVGDDVLPVARYRRILAAAGSAELVSSTDLLTELRQVKSEAEVEAMEAAARLNDQALRYVLRWIRVGMTEMQVAALAEYAGRSMGADLGSATVIMSGPNTQYPAWRPSQRVIRPGDMVLVDFNPTVRQYSNDGGVTLLMPGAPPELRAALVAAHRVLKEVIRDIRPHSRAHSIFDHMLLGLESRGYRDNFEPWARLRQGVGHGVGIDVVEPPFLNAQSDFELVPGMTLAIKLDLHSLPGRTGLRVESVVHITESGARALNRLVVDEADDVAVLRASGSLVERIMAGLVVAAFAALRYALQMLYAPAHVDPLRMAWQVWMCAFPLAAVFAGPELYLAPALLLEPVVLCMLLVGGSLNLAAQSLFAGELGRGEQGAAQALALTPLLMALGSALALDEPPTPVALCLAPVIALAGALEAGLLVGSRPSGVRRRLLVAASLWAASASCDASGARRTTPALWALLQCCFLAAAAPLVLRARGVPLVSALPRGRRGWLSPGTAAVALAFLAEAVAQNRAVLGAPAADVMALKRTSALIIPALPRLLAGRLASPSPPGGGCVTELEELAGPASIAAVVGR